MEAHEFGASDRRDRSLEITDAHWVPNSPFGNLAVRLGRAHVCFVPKGDISTW